MAGLSGTGDVRVSQSFGPGMYQIGRGWHLICKAILPQAPNGVAMIPPQALHYLGLHLAKVTGMGVARLTAAVIERGADAEIFRLSKLDEPALLMEIARKDNADIALGKPDEIVQYGQATVHRLLPKARALICPHRYRLLMMVDSPEVTVIAAVAGYLMGGLPGTLVKPVATLLVKRGMPLLCDN